MAEQTTNNGTVCHILPCSIEEDMTAPIAQYFHPTTLPDNVMPKKNDSSDDGDAKKRDDGVTIMAAQFRGRGLLCAVDSPAQGRYSTTAVASSSCEEDGNSNSSPSSKSTTKALSKLPSNLMGVALSQSTTNTTSTSTTTNNSNDAPMQSLKVIEKFQHVYNWSHEDDVSKMMREQIYGNDKVGLNAVVGWCDLAHEVHDPIPVPP